MKTKISDIQFKVGLFIFLGLVIFFVFIFSQGKFMRGRGYELKVVYNYVGGLDTGAPVRVSGYKVGEVKDIDLSIEQEKPKIVVTVRINPKIHLGRHSRFTVRNYGIIGEKYMEIMPTGLNDTPIIKPGERVIGEDPLPLERFLSTGEDILKNLNSILISINKVTQDENLKTQISQIIEGTKNLVLKTSDTVGSFNDLASTWDSAIAEIGPDLKDLISNVNSSSKEVNSILIDNRKKIDNIITNLDHTALELNRTIPIASEQIKNSGEAFIKTNNKITQLIEKTESQGLFADLITDTEIAREIKETIKGLKQTSTDLDISFAKLEYVSDQISSILSNIQEGKGTVGKLFMQDELYNEIFEMVQDLKAHPWKILFRGKEK
ncbi:MAG: mce related protein [candidate division TA06 bacterium ADurb.Bin131]|jgi:phospholipid/cholesterol/gamma-HCH transport system substrate-binding protein|uniref:Mce related protein n=1 Tax=candidate division TA06 bacterium ADurb.Bin131 TaxID=1852827 RepID=A0A1V6CA57_UNCT6|nr:MAG: mce related protein [candidate division TA06 bacterium ADurb.Bin131]HOC02975.1 MlaD family protein [bacterium]